MAWPAIVGDQKRSVVEDHDKVLHGSRVSGEVDAGRITTLLKDRPSHGPVGSESDDPDGISVTDERPADACVVIDRPGTDREKAAPRTQENELTSANGRKVVPEAIPDLADLLVRKLQGGSIEWLGCGIVFADGRSV
jgi:hypothetical protein